VSETLTPSALERLLAHRDRFLNFVRKRVDSPETAEDILQAAFLRSLERAETVRDEESVVAWFYRLLRNAVVDHYRRQDVERRGLEAWTLQQPDPEMKREVCDCIFDLVATLKPDYRQALEAVDLGEGSLRDLASRAGITPGNAAVRVHRAREALKRQVRLVCGSCAEHGCVDCSCRSG